MTIDEKIKLNPDYVYTRFARQWNGCDVYESLHKTQLDWHNRYNGSQNPPPGGGPSYHLVEKNGEVRRLRWPEVGIILQEIGNDKVV